MPENQDIPTGRPEQARARGHSGPLANILRPVFYLSHNLISRLGVVLTTSSGLTLVLAYFFQLFGMVYNPYAGILVFLLLPVLFVAGLLLIPLGIYRDFSRSRRLGRLPLAYPAIDFHEARLKQTALFVAIMTALNVPLFAIATYRGTVYMDSVQFCGQTCHQVMQPEYTAYQQSPHSRVECVKCHIGPGASWFVRSKLSGVGQVFAVTFHTYSRPIPSPVKYLRPARETCEQCHWPQRFTGDKFLVNTTYKDDEKNTPQTDVLLLKVGGHTWQGSVGIHGRHLADNARIRYISTDAERQTIPVVYFTDDQGKTTEFISTDSKPTQEQLDKGEHRTMDCVDCHNRPTHEFDLPENAVDKQMSLGHISPELPFIRKKAVEVLKVNYATRDVARQNIAAELNNFYRTNYPQIYLTRRTLVQQAGDEVAAIYLHNIFPDMRVTWGVHPNNLGHNDSPGCFRCHDGSHTSADGRTITNDCSACHNLLAVGEQNPKVLAELGMK